MFKQRDWIALGLLVLAQVGLVVGFWCMQEPPGQGKLASGVIHFQDKQLVVPAGEIVGVEMPLPDTDPTTDDEPPLDSVAPIMPASFGQITPVIETGSFVPMVPSPSGVAIPDLSLPTVAGSGEPPVAPIANNATAQTPAVGSLLPPTLSLPDILPAPAKVDGGKSAAVKPQFSQDVIPPVAKAVPPVPPPGGPLEPVPPLPTPQPKPTPNNGKPISIGMLPLDVPPPSPAPLEEPINPVKPLPHVNPPELPPAGTPHKKPDVPIPQAVQLTKPVVTVASSQVKSGTPAMPPSVCKPHGPPAKVEGPSPWHFQVAIIDQRTVLTAKSDSGATFEIRCDSLNLSRPVGGVEASGNVQIKGKDLDASCDRVVINWSEDRLLLNGDAHLKRVANGELLELHGPQLQFHLSCAPDRFLGFHRH